MCTRYTAISLLLFCFTAINISACSEQKQADKKQKRKQRVHLVSTTNSQLQSLSTPTTRTGTLEIQNQVRIFNQEEGKITSLKLFPGDTFQQGDTLIQLDGSLLQAQLEKASATRKQAEQDLRRTSSLVKKRLAAEDERARFETALRVAAAEEQLLRTRLAYTRIKAPFTGTVSERLVEPGDVAPRHTHLMTIIDKHSMVIKLNVSELLLPLFKIGDQATISVDSLGSQTFKGTISRIHPTIDSRTRLGIVEVKFVSIPDNVRSGSLCRVTLSPAAKPYIVVPFSALRRDKKGEYVFVIDNQQTARKQYISSGLRHGKLISITKGLQADTAIISRGFLNLRDGAKVTTKQASQRKKTPPDKTS